jgi:hypothetical protein
MRFDADGPAGLGKSQRQGWDCLQTPTLPSWMTKDTNGGATYLEEDPTIAGGGVIMIPAQSASAQALIDLPAMNLGQFRAVRFRCVFSTGQVVGNITMRLGEVGVGRGARIVKIRYEDSLKLGVVGGIGSIRHLNSRLPNVAADKRYDFSLVIENTVTSRNLYALQGEQVVDVWNNVEDLMWLDGEGSKPGFSVSQYENPSVLADIRVTLRSMSLERWL